MYVPSDMAKAFKSPIYKRLSDFRRGCRFGPNKETLDENCNKQRSFGKCIISCHLVTNERLSFYIMGSGFEGSRTVNMPSDLDFLYCYEYLEVIQNIDEARGQNLCLLAVQDGHTKPGYAKLQYLFEGEPISTKTTRQYTVHFKTDFKGRVVHGEAEQLYLDFGRDR